jgi:hypothetical protein
VAKKKLLLVKFGAANKSQFTIRVGHTRTGACPRKRGRCTCPKRKK